MLNKTRELKVFIVNLKKDTQKKEHMQRLCNKYKLKVEFVEAVYGKELLKEEVDKVYNRELSIKYFKRDLALPEIGCACSHINIYKSIVKDKIEYALILEDDISFNTDLLKIEDQIKYFPKKWDIVLLGHHSAYSRDIDTQGSIWNKKMLFDSYTLQYPVENGYGTYGYLVSLNGAKKLIQTLQTIIYPIDHYTGSSKYVNVYLIKPSVIKINDSISECFTSMNDRNSIEEVKKFKSIKYIIRYILIKSDLISAYFKIQHFFIKFKYKSYQS